MKRTITTEAAPQAIGPYAQAIRAGDLLFLSGQIGLTPEGVLAGEDIETQTRQVMENLKAVLAAAGATFDDVVRTTVYLVDLDDFAKMNDVYAIYFNDIKPARATVGVAALPKSAKVEIDAIAVIDR